MSLERSSTQLMEHFLKKKKSKIFGEKKVFRACVLFQATRSINSAAKQKSKKGRKIIFPCIYT